MSMLDRGTIVEALSRLNERLANHGGRAEVLALVLEYFPADRLPVRVRLLIDEMFDDRT